MTNTFSVKYIWAELWNSSARKFYKQKNRFNLLNYNQLIFFISNYFKSLVRHSYKYFKVYIRFQWSSSCLEENTKSLFF